MYILQGEEYNNWSSDDNSTLHFTKHLIMLLQAKDIYLIHNNKMKVPLMTIAIIVRFLFDEKYIEVMKTLLKLFKKQYIKIN